MGQGCLFFFFPGNSIFKREAEVSSMKKSKTDHEEVQAETKESSTTDAKGVRSSWSQR